MKPRQLVGRQLIVGQNVGLVVPESSIFGKQESMIVPTSIVSWREGLCNKLFVLLYIFSLTISELIRFFNVSRSVVCIKPPDIN